MLRANLAAWLLLRGCLAVPDGCVAGECVADHLSMLQRPAMQESMSVAGAADAFSYPFAYTLMGPGTTLVARLLLAIPDPLPKEFVVGESPVPWHMRAEPAVGNGVFHIDNKTYNTQANFAEVAQTGSPRTPFSFSDRVVEAIFESSLVLGNEAYFLFEDGRRIKAPLPVRRPSTFLIVGDTGLRIKPKNDGWCDKKLEKPEDLYSTKTCPSGHLLNEYNASLVAGLFQGTADSIDPTENGWPLRRLSEVAAQHVDDATVVVHVGDFTYRHAACPMPFPKQAPPGEERVFGSCENVGSAWGDTTEGWRAELFEPMAKLFRAAPWMVFRGNHERCRRGGMGWFRYLDPRPGAWSPDALPGSSTAAPFCLTYSDAYRVEFENDLWLVVDNAEIHQTNSVDSSPPVEYTDAQAVRMADSEIAPLNMVCAEQDKYTSDLFTRYASSFASLGPLALGTSQARRWIGMHRPIFGLLNTERSPDNKPQQFASLKNLDCELLIAAALSNVSIPNVLGVVSGHWHAFEWVKLQGWPSQVIIGNSGTQLATPRNGDPYGIERARGRKLLGHTVTGAKAVGEFGFGLLRVPGDHTDTANMTVQFLQDRHFAGTPDVSLLLTPETFFIDTTFNAAGTPP